MTELAQHEQPSCNRQIQRDAQYSSRADFPLRCPQQPDRQRNSRGERRLLSGSRCDSRKPQNYPITQGLTHGCATGNAATDDWEICAGRRMESPVADLGISHKRPAHGRRHENLIVLRDLKLGVAVRPAADQEPRATHDRISLSASSHPERPRSWGVEELWPAKVPVLVAFFCFYKFYRSQCPLQGPCVDLKVPLSENFPPVPMEGGPKNHEKNASSCR